MKSYSWIVLADGLSQAPFSAVTHGRDEYVTKILCETNTTFP